MKNTKRLFFSMDVDNVEGSQLAIQPLIDFSKKESLDTSFFITGRFAEMYPIETKLIFTEGYDNPETKWGCSGYHYTRGGPWIDNMDTSNIKRLSHYEKIKLEMDNLNNLNRG